MIAFSGESRRRRKRRKRRRRAFTGSVYAYLKEMEDRED